MPSLASIPELVERAERDADAFVAKLRERFHDDASSDEYASALEDALKERLRVNVGLLAENRELRTRLAGRRTWP